MDWKEIFKTFVCLLLICCLIINLSPIRAEAAAIEVAAVVGIAAIMILNASGVIYLPQSLEDVVSMGDSLKKSLNDWASTSEELAAVQNFFTGMQSLDFDKGVSSGITSFPIISALKTGLGLWIADMVTDGTVIQKGSFTSAKADSYELPYWDIGKFPYFFIQQTSPPGGSIWFSVCLSDAPVSYLGDISMCKYYSPRPISEYPSYKFTKISKFSSNEWVFDEYVYTRTNVEVLDKALWSIPYGQYMSSSAAPKIVYANYNIYDLNGNIHLQGDTTSVAYVDVPFLPESLVGDVASGLLDGTASVDDLVIPDSLELGGIISSNSSAVDDVLNLQDKLVAGDITYDDYLGMVLADTPTFTQNLDTNLVTYNLGDVAQPLTVTATVDDGGTLSYQWYQRMTGVLVSPLIPGATAASYTPSTEKAGKYHYYCLVTNTNAKGCTAFVTSKTATVEVVDSAFSETLSDTKTGTFINELVDSLVQSVDALSATQEQAATITAQGYIDDFLGKIPDHSGEFLESLDPLVTVLKYEGTDAIITMPAITIPAVGGMIVQTTVLDEQTINFKDYFEMMPQVIMVLIHAFFDIAVIVYCSKEFLELLGSVASAVFGFHREEA